MLTCTTMLIVIVRRTGTGKSFVEQVHETQVVVIVIKALRSSFDPVAGCDWRRQRTVRLWALARCGAESRSGPSCVCFAGQIGVSQRGARCQRRDLRELTSPDDGRTPERSAAAACGMVSGVKGHAPAQHV